VNLGFESERNATAFELKGLFTSSMKSYPDYYKFVGLQINVKESRSITSRKTYGLLEFWGEIGGNFELIWLIGFLTAKGFVTFNFLALTANRMYIWKAPNQVKGQKQKKNPAT
jgi:hypothetical protein